MKNSTLDWYEEKKVRVYFTYSEFEHAFLSLAQLYATTPVRRETTKEKLSFALDFFVFLFFLFFLVLLVSFLHAACFCTVDARQT